MVAGLDSAELVSRLRAAHADTDVAATRTGTYLASPNASLAVTSLKRRELVYWLGVAHHPKGQPGNST